MPLTPYLEKYPAIKADLNLLIAEYKQIEDKLVDVTSSHNQVLVQKKFHIQKADPEYHHYWCEEKGLFPYTLEIAEKIRAVFNFNSITYRSIQPNTAYNWHVDTGATCYHIPLITNPGSWFIYEHRCFHMPADGSVYLVNNGRPHTFVNSGYEPRVHLTFEIL